MGRARIWQHSTLSAALLLLCAVLLARLQGHSRVSAETRTARTTAEHIASERWWPTDSRPPRAAYAGNNACATCHADVVRSQQHSEMAQTLRPAEQSPVLQQHLKDSYLLGSYKYTLNRPGNLVQVHVTDTTGSQAAALEWAFGSGEVGQSYLWRAPDGSFREGRFNFFASLRGFAATPGRLHGEPVDLGMALGRRVEAFEARTCFSCHTTALTADSGLSHQEILAGIGCEACHGPGKEHIAAMQANADAPDTRIVSPEHMSPEQSVDLCGACHSTAWDVRLMGATGTQTVRFPAYRLEKSRCWGAHGDDRLTCPACHNPHAPLQRDVTAYDRACLQCHATSHPNAAQATVAAAKEVSSAKACPVASTKCVSCHMQKVELPELHANFTDHMIRVVRSRDAVPD